MIPYKVYKHRKICICVTKCRAEFYPKSTDKTFSLQIPTVDTFHSLLTTPDEKKSACFEDIPNKLLKMVIAPSLTGIFSASIRAGVFLHLNGRLVGSRQYTKVCKVVPRMIQTTIVPNRLFQSLQRSLKKLSLINYMNTLIPTNC